MEDPPGEVTIIPSGMKDMMRCSILNTPRLRIIIPPQDTMHHINVTYAVKNTRLILATLAELAEAGLLSNPPATPVLTGPDTGVINEMYTFHAVTTEPDGENVYYFFDWGDGIEQRMAWSV